jgi:hypothetical protein
MLALSTNQSINQSINYPVCQLFAEGQCFFPGTLLSSTKITDHHDIAEILLKVALNTIAITPISGS